MLTVIGCGNLIRGDDGVGVVVARRLIEFLQRHTPPDVAVFDAGTDGLDVMYRARGAKKLVLVDASRSGSQPGAVFEVPGETLASNYEPTYSLHDFRWDHALYAGRKIYGASFPTDVTVFLIEAGELGFGWELSEPVRRAADKVIAQIESMIDDHVAATTT